MKVMQSNIQDTFLNTLRRDKISVTMFLTNGFQIRGLVKSFDNFVVLFECDGKQNMVYKHAISTIVPIKNVDVQEREES